LTRSVLAGVGLACISTVARAATLDALPGEGRLPLPEPGACPFCAAGKPCQEHVS
jgi:hypothetical protein